jgi:hypothetical protein
MGLRLVLATVLALSAFSLDASAQRRDRIYNGYGGITVYEDPDFRGDRASFDNEVADLRQYGLNDRISSIELYGNQAWEVCRDVNFSGPCQIVNGSMDDLRADGWNDRISSMRAVGYARNDNRGGWWGNNGNGRNSNRANRQARLVFYNQTNFRGQSQDLFNNSGNLGSMGDRARSVQVYGGTWELCDGSGSSRNSRCVTVSQSISDLRSLGLRNGVSSAREVGYSNSNSNRGRWW